MDKVVLKQKIPFAIRTQFGIPLTALFFALTVVSFYFLPFFVLVMLFMLSGYSYEFNKASNHKIVIRVFGFNIFRVSKSFLEPEYVSLFNQSFSTPMSFDFMELGSAKYKEFVIKIFNGNNNEIVFKSKKKEDVLSLGMDLAKLLNVELYNTLE